jgi:hypothetical protein
MGKRREPRKQIQVPVRIFGTDSSGNVFSEAVVTVNVGQQGVEVSGVRSEVKSDEILGLTYGTNRARFKVRWIGTPGTPKAGHLGLQNIAPEKPLWDFELPSAGPDARGAAAQSFSNRVPEFGGTAHSGRRFLLGYHRRPERRRLLCGNGDSAASGN